MPGSTSRSGTRGSASTTAALARLVDEGDPTGLERLEDADGDARMVDRAYANVAYTGIYAGHLPDVVGTVTDVLGTGR
ncbi:MAG: hypothetical protein V5A62_09550 [Haloarculaceae archaeon]